MMQLTKAQVLHEPTEFEPWLVACVTISQQEAHRVLSAPHFIEHEPTRTAGGSEEHWNFSFPCGMKVGILLRTRYEVADIYADPPLTENALEYLEPLIRDKETRIPEAPILRL